MALSLITFAPLFGQGPGGGSGPPAPRPAGPPELSLPIDDHLYILIVLGILYGAYVTYKKINARTKRTAA